MIKDKQGNPIDLQPLTVAVIERYLKNAGEDTKDWLVQYQIAQFMKTHHYYNAFNKKELHMYSKKRVKENGWFVLRRKKKKGKRK